MNPLRKISVADLMTLSNGFFGLMAIFFAIDGQIVISCTLLMVSVVFDGLDGMFARLFGTKHDYGRYLDSMADVISFCFAPGILIYMTFIHSPGSGSTVQSSFTNPFNFIVLVTAILVISLGLFRLVKFTLYDYDRKDFQGIPTTAATLYFVMIVYFSYQVGQGSLTSWIFVTLFKPIPMLLSLMVVAYLMVSDITYIKVRGKIGILVGSVVAMLIVSFILTASDLAPGRMLNFIPQIIGLGCVVFYVMICPVLDLANRGESGYWMRRKEKRTLTRSKRAIRKTTGATHGKGHHPMRTRFPAISPRSFRRPGNLRPPWRIGRDTDRSAGTDTTYDTLEGDDDELDLDDL